MLKSKLLFVYFYFLTLNVFSQETIHSEIIYNFNYNLNSFNEWTIEGVTFSPSVHKEDNFITVAGGNSDCILSNNINSTKNLNQVEIYFFTEQFMNNANIELFISNDSSDWKLIDDYTNVYYYKLITIPKVNVFDINIDTIMFFKFEIRNEEGDMSHFKINEFQVSCKYSTFIGIESTVKIVSDIDFYMFSNSLNINSKIDFEGHLYIYNCNGQIIKYEELVLQSDNKTFNLSEFSSGMYFILIYNKEFVLKDKLFIN